MLAVIGEDETLVASAPIGLCTDDGNSQAGVICARGLKAYAYIHCLLSGQNICKAGAVVILSRDMDISPTETMAVELTLAFPADAVAHLVAADQRTDFQMDQLDHMFAQIAPKKLTWFEVRKPG